MPVSCVLYMMNANEQGKQDINFFICQACIGSILQAFHERSKKLHTARLYEYKIQRLGLQTRCGECNVHLHMYVEFYVFMNFRPIYYGYLNEMCSTLSSQSGLVF